MVKLGLLGKNISHSRSQEMYEKLLGEKVDYQLLDYQDENSLPELEALFQQGFLGLSLTYPFKKSYLSHVEIEEDNVKEIGAINCIKKVDNKFLATNTDYRAALDLIDVKENTWGDLNWIILGSGNMAQVFQKALAQKSRNFVNFNRKKHGDLNQISFVDMVEQKRRLILVNCCSRQFVFKSNLPKGSVFWDMNYSFPDHNHLYSKDFHYVEGDDLLFGQAKHALNYWKIKYL